MRFGDREYAVSVVVSPVGLEPDFALWEWCEIFGDALSSSDGQFCNTVPRLKAELERHAQTLKKLQTRITNSSEKDFVALRAARSNRMDEWLAQNKHAEHERSRSIADEAFRKQDLGQVDLVDFVDLFFVKCLQFIVKVADILYSASVPDNTRTCNVQGSCNLNPAET